METKTYIYNIYTSLTFCLLLCSGLISAQKSKMNVSAVGSAAPAEKGDGPQVFTEGNYADAANGQRKEHPLLTEDELKLCLFDAKALNVSYSQLMGMRSFFEQYRAESFFKACIPALFRDRVKPELVECYPAHKLLQGSEPINPRTNTNALLKKLLGEEGYNEFIFCMSYLGMSYTDPELWQLYFEKNQTIVSDLLKFENAGMRLKMYLLALDMEQKLCKAASGGFETAM